MTLRDKIGLDVQDARGLVKHGSDQFEPLAGDEPYADKPAHEIAALKRTGRIPRTAQLYDPSLIAEVAADVCARYCVLYQDHEAILYLFCCGTGAATPRRRLTTSRGKSRIG